MDNAPFESTKLWLFLPIFTAQRPKSTFLVLPGPTLWDATFFSVGTARVRQTAISTRGGNIRVEMLSAWAAFGWRFRDEG